MRIFLIIILTVLANKGSAQVANFNQFQEPYLYLKNDYAPFVNFKWGDSFSFDFDLTDTITFDTLSITNILVQGNGYASLSSPFSPNNSNIFIVPFFVTNLLDKSLKTNSNKASSPISYKYDWLNGEKILKVQWKNVGFQYGSVNDSANFQFWLFTKSQKVQFRYGESYIKSLDSIVQEDTMQIGVEIYSDLQNRSTLLAGNPYNFYVSTNSSSKYYGIPLAGTVYEFKSLSLGLNRQAPLKINYKIDDQQLKITTATQNIKQLELVDLLGNVVASTHTNTIPLYSINTGVYILRLQTNDSLITQKVFINSQGR